MNDLELCKRIAEIEGENIAGVGDENVYIKCQPSLVGNVQYNPLTDDALCFQLMIKYDVHFTPLSSDFYRTNGKYKKLYCAEIMNETKTYSSEYIKEPNKAILLAIIEAYES